MPTKKHGKDKYDRKDHKIDWDRLNDKEYLTDLMSQNTTSKTINHTTEKTIK